MNIAPISISITSMALPCKRVILLIYAVSIVNAIVNAFNTSSSPITPYHPESSLYTLYSSKHTNNQDKIPHGTSLHCSGPGFEHPSTLYENIFHCKLHTPHNITIDSKHVNILGLYIALEGEHQVMGAYSIHHNLMEYKFRWNISISGEYSISFILMTNIGQYPIHKYRMHRLHVTGTSLNLHTPLPICSNQADGRGIWLKCHTTDDATSTSHQSECMRWGYRFQPPTCRYLNYNHLNLQSSSTQSKHWIVFLGNSVIRGMYLSAVDMLLGPRTTHLIPLSKCWGRSDVQLGNIRLTYIDARGATGARYPLRTAYTASIECHGRFIASNEYDIQQNTSLLLHNLFLDKENSPTTLVISMVHKLIYLDMITTDSIIQSIAYTYRDYYPLPNWFNGHIIIPIIRQVTYNNIQHHAISSHFEQIFTQAYGRNIQLIDTIHILIPFLLYRENGLNHNSVHWHSTIDVRHKEPYLPIKYEELLIRNEGIATDMIAQIVFNLEFNHLQVNSSKSTSNLPLSSTLFTNASLLVCTDCPLDLMPFQTRPSYNLICSTSMPHPSVNTLTYSPVEVCPEWCLRDKQAKLSSIVTGSGPVVTRICQWQDKSS